MPSHLIYCCGAKVKVEGMEVEVLEDPVTTYCPLSSRIYGVERIDREAVKQIVLKKLRDKGFASERRVFTSEVLVPFGASEVTMSCMRRGLVECAVTVCEGVGTVVASSPELVQMIGSFLTGIISTHPVSGILSRVKGLGGVVLDEATAKIDQVDGVKLAAQMGFKRIAVTVAGFRCWEIPALRRVEEELKLELVVMVVCTTRVGVEDLKSISMADLVWACNSKLIKEKLASQAKFQLGVSIPVFALTSRGKAMLLTHLGDLEEPMVAFRAKLPYEAPGKGPRS